jgi:membrane protease YdiL (CAAX protease family)
MKRELIVFFALAYLLSWVIWLPLYLPYFGIHVIKALPFNHALGGLGPMLASLALTFFYKGKEGLLQLMRSLVQVKPFNLLVIVLIGPFLLLMLSLVLSSSVNSTSLSFHHIGISKEFPDFNIITFFIYNLIFFGFGEETGWRGYALPRLQENMNAFWASTALTVGWALWHWPLFLYRPGYTSMDIYGIIGWILSLYTGSILLTWLYNSSRGSVLICAVFHSTIDIAFTSDVADPNVIGYLGMFVTLWGIAVIFIFKPRYLSRVKFYKHQWD